MALTRSNSEEKFPYPSWDEAFLSAIDCAIRQAWANVIATGIDLSQSSEDQITEKLEDQLEKILNSGDNKVFNRSKFQDVIRGGNFCNYNKKSITKQPDLIIRPVDLTPGIDNRYHGLFIECKILDKKDKSELKYIENGIKRFVDGEYAWAMTHAMMLAYVRAENISLPSSLEKCFSRNIKKPFIVECCSKDNFKKMRETEDGSCYVSTHCRGWVHEEHGDPGDIRLDHLWLTVK